MIMYPKWKAIIGAAVFFSILKYAIEFNEYKTDKIEMFALIGGSFVNGAILFMVGFFRIKYEKLLMQVRKLTLTDPLTGLYNRRYFDLYLEKVVHLNQGGSLVLMMLDIDYFKKINDQYGHQCGDEALKHISETIKQHVRKSDGYVRFGGEEFAIILPNITPEKAQDMAEQLRNALDQTPFIYKNKQIHFTISIGVAVYSGETTEAFIEKADKGLYQAKENGRNQVVFLN